MGLSLRDLMKREKESRKRKSSQDEEENKSKLQKISHPLEDQSLKEEVTRLKEPLTSDSAQKAEFLTTFESQSDNVDEQSSKSTGVTHKHVNENDINFDNVNNNSSEVPENFSVPSSLNKLKENLTDIENSDKPKELLKRTVSENSTDLEVLEETYELLEDDESPTGVSSSTDDELNNKPKHGSSLLNDYDDYNEVSKDLQNKSDENYTVVDENRLVYEQLNTAYCSNLDYEHENILREAGFKQNQRGLGALINPGCLGSKGNLPNLGQLGEMGDLGNSGVYGNLYGNVDEYQLDLDDEDDFELESEDQNKNVITSSNFGVSTLSVSSTDNLPVGFFDDQNVDAKARGKLTAKEAQNKIKELTKRRSTYLKEAKYIQQKLVEEHREQTKMENDLLDHKETYKELQDKLNKIKGDLNVDTNNLKIDPERENKVEEILKEYSDLDYDDLSWMSRSIV